MLAGSGSGPWHTMNVMMNGKEVYTYRYRALGEGVLLKRSFLEMEEEGWSERLCGGVHHHCAANSPLYSKHKIKRNHAFQAQDAAEGEM